MDAASSYKTAIRRKQASAPLRELLRRDLVVGPCLDYGCGWGADRDAVNLSGQDCEGYDPDPAKGCTVFRARKYKTVLCTYVLNTLSERAGTEVIREILDLYLRKRGTLCVTVRRDIKAGSRTQRQVYLPYETVTENSAFCIYRVVR